MTSPVYIPTETFERLAHHIAEKLEPCAFTGRVTANEVKIALGEIGNIWPLSIALDAALAGND